MTWIELVDRLCVLTGIEPYYFDIPGNRHETTLESKVLVLGALGCDVSSAKAAADSLNALETAPWREQLAPFHVRVWGADGFDVDLFLPAEGELRNWGWQITFEDGKQASGTFQPQDLNLLGSREVDGRLVEHRRLRINANAPAGYHHLQIMQADARSATIALAPRSSYLPNSLKVRDGRLWGLSSQFYTLRSADNWGIGDFGDLARVCRMAGRAGASAVAINPLHALFPDRPDAASPYSPSSRLFLNPIYIDAASAFPRPSGPAHGFQASLAPLRASAMIDYPGVWTAKRRALELLFQAAQKLPAHDQLMQNFRRFVEAGGPALEQFAVFCTLEEIHGDGGRIPWQQWPAACQVPESEGMERFKREQARRIQFHQFVQYLADEQLKKVALEAGQSGMEIGIVRDLALGANPDGCDAWMLQGAFAGSLRCGAPPDDFNPRGQEWGVLPLDPLRLRRDYQPFIAMLRANMRHAGGLRIDHVIGLQRQFLVPPEGRGCYVRFPLDELMSLLALESHRNTCLVVGEDLGTVPEGFRDRMQQAGILGCSLAYFERSEDGAFRPPRHYRKKAVASIATHDLPTFRGYWEGEDIAVKRNLDIISTAEADAAREQRQRDREALTSALATGGFLDGPAGACGPEAVPAVRDALHAFLASSSAELFLAQVDDLMNEKDQVNLPGTTDQYPNWRRKLGVSLDERIFFEAIEQLAAICRAQARGQKAAGGHSDGTN